MWPSNKTIQEFKVLMEKEYRVKYTDQEAEEAVRNLVGLFDLLMKLDHKDKSV